MCTQTVGQWEKEDEGEYNIDSWPQGWDVKVGEDSLERATCTYYCPMCSSCTHWFYFSPV